MPDFNRMLYTCEKTSAMSKRLVDDFLLHLCAHEEGLDRKFSGLLANYLSIIRKMPEEWPLYLKSQYVVFQLFRKSGLAAKYLNHPQVRQRSAKELDYLKFQIEHPWRFVFCRVEQNSKGDFFEMKDVLTGENFPLYSPGVAETEKQQGFISLYFLLIGFNGECWQTYGTLAYFKGIQPFDIRYFAKQLKPDLVSMDEIPKLIEAEPLPFMMLWTGGNFPLSYHKEDMVVIMRSDYQQEEFDPDKLNRDFVMEQKPPVYMFSLKHWHGMPHFCKCFYNEETKILSLNAMTDRGYAKLVEVLNQAGYKFPVEPEMRVTPAMSMVIKEVLGREIAINPYEKLFAKEPSPGAKAELDKMNSFLKKLMDAQNSGKDYDLRELAFLAGIEFEQAKKIADQVMGKFKQLRK